jgi:hypothetical protein
MTTTNRPPAISVTTAIQTPPGGLDKQAAARTESSSLTFTPLPAQTAGDSHKRDGTHTPVGVPGGILQSQSPPGQSEADFQQASAGGPDQQAAATYVSLPNNGTLLPVQTTGDGQIEVDAQPAFAVPGSDFLRSPILGLAAEVVDDLERVRKGNRERLRSLTSTEDGRFGLSAEHSDVARLAALVAYLDEAEDQAVKNLQKIMRAHPLGPWCKATTGIGEKQLARLLAAIGDPFWHVPENRSRTVSELWAYCGFRVLHPGGQSADDDQGSLAAGVAQAHRKGVQGNWSDTARMRAWLIGTQIVKTPTSPYRPVYDEARVKYAEAVHAQACVRCGPRGKPAQQGTPLSDGHQHARAVRVVAKRVLRDLWREAKRLHEQPAEAIIGSLPIVVAPLSGQTPGDSQSAFGIHHTHAVPGV